jgi:hypothetical protein
MLSPSPAVDLVDLFMQLRDHIGDQPAPTRLVRGAKPASILAVEIFIEQDVVFDVRIRLHLLITTEDGPSSLLVASEDIRQTALQFYAWRKVTLSRHPASANRLMQQEEPHPSLGKERCQSWRGTRRQRQPSHIREFIVYSFAGDGTALT